MAVRVRKTIAEVETSPTVVRYGWRDEPYEGPEPPCTDCGGWGERAATIGTGAGRKVVHRTCSHCRGKGHE